MLTDELLAKLEMMERDHNRLKAEVYELRRRIRQAEIADDDRELGPCQIDTTFLTSYTRFASTSPSGAAQGQLGVGHARPIARSNTVGVGFLGADQSFAELDGEADVQTNRKDPVTLHNLGWPIGYQKLCLYLQDAWGDLYAINPVPCMGHCYAAESIAVGATGLIQFQNPHALNGESSTTWFEAPEVQAVNYTGVDLTALDNCFAIEDNMQRAFYIVGTEREINP